MSSREELQKKIQHRIKNDKLATGDPSPFTEYSVYISKIVMEVVDEFIAQERTEKEQTVGRYDVYEGMRIKVVYQDESEVPPVGATGTVILPDHDGVPGVQMDSPWDKYNKKRRGTTACYLDVRHIVEIEDGGT